jgi:SOS-response transcriptional repressor LexA
MLRDNLHTAIEASGLYVKEIAARADVKKKTIDKWTGIEAIEPKVMDFYKVCKVLRITMEQAVDDGEGFEYVKSLLQESGTLWQPPARLAQIVNDLAVLDDGMLAVFRVGAEMAAELKGVHHFNSRITASQTYIPPKFPDDTPVTEVPLMGATLEPRPQNAVKPIGTIKVPQPLITDPTATYFTVIQRGMSMFYAGIQHNDVVLIKFTDKPQFDQINLVYYQGMWRIARLILSQDGYLLKREDGSNFHTVVPRDKCVAQGVFVAVIDRACPNSKVIDETHTEA